MRDQHAKVSGAHVQFTFRGKSGAHHAVDLRDARLARIVKACRDLPGFELFQYIDDAGARQTIDSADVNAYVREVTGQDFTAKDFRTWAGTMIAAKALAGVPRFASAAESKRNIVRAVEHVAKSLGNTKAVSRKCYIHPSVLDAYLDGVTLPVGGDAHEGTSQMALGSDEAAVVALLQRRLRKTA
jgi:DNA topoisomerase-1